MNGMAKMAIKAGMASTRFSHSIFTTCCIIRNPTTTRAGAVAKDGIARKTGERNRAIRKSPPATIEVSPVLPPSAMPDEDSTNVVMVEVPRTAPTVVPTASANRAPLICGSFPSLSSMSALDAQPIRVPRVSNMSTNRNANITTTKFSVPTTEKSSFMKVGATLAGMENTPLGKRL